MDGTSDLMRERIRTIQEIRDLGVDPFSAEPFDAADTARGVVEEFGGRTREELEGEETTLRLAGRLVALRSFGKAAFAHLQDSTGRIQVFFQKNVLGDDFKLVKKLNVGDIVGVRGTPFRTRTDELTIDVSSFRLLTKSVRPLPEKWHGLTDVETRYRQRYADLIMNPEVRETFVTRSRIIRAVRRHLDENGFLEVETPMMQSIPGGAAARPFRTHHNALDIDLFLRIAPELYLKRLLVGGFERVYELNRNFRNEGVSTRHNPEFTMVEFYMAYADYRGMMDFLETMLVSIVREITGGTVLRFEGREIDFRPPWPRLSMVDALLEKGVPETAIRDLEALKAWAGDNGIEIGGAPSLGKGLDEVFEALVEPGLVRPTFVIDHPVELSPLAKRKKDAPHLVERFELFVANREIANAFSELNDPFDQKERFLAQLSDREKGDDEAHRMDADYIRALEYGMPPAAGCGIGIDRLVMLLTDSPSIRDVILFPQMKPEG